MKKTGALIIFMFSVMLVKGQTNLVPNWSFEIDSLCPDAGSEINYAPPWQSAGADPDYFNACAGSLIASMGVPLNWGGYQYPKTGVAYAGIYAYSGYTGATIEIREYIEVKLIDSLIFGKKYCVSFYVNLAKPAYTALTYNNVAIKEIGLYLSDTALMSPNQDVLPFVPQIVSTPGVFLNDTVNWTEISGTYIAHGGEKYIIIGNFKPFGLTDTLGIVHYNNYTASYYFIDDVTVRDCTYDGVEEIDKVDINISPNPATNQFTIENSQLRINVIHIYNVLGEEVLERIVNSEKAIDVSTWNAGVYFVEVETEKGIVRKKLVKQ